MINSSRAPLLFASAAALAFLAGVEFLPPAVLAQSQTQVMDFFPQDTSLNINATNYSGDSVLTTYTWPDQQVANAILMMFDLSALPDDAFVTGATLHLALVESDASEDATYIVTAHKILNTSPVIAQATGYKANSATNWTPNACCYNGVPLGQADLSPAYDQPAIDKTPGFKTWTLTALVQEWLADPASNRGLLLNSDASTLRDRYRFFASMEHADASLRPFLRVTFSASDATPPSVAITAPASGATVSSTSTVTATASDNVGVAGVQFRLDGAPLGSERTGAPYTVDWDTTGAADGAHTLTAVARDSAGNVASSAAVPVTVQNGVIVLTPQDTSLNINALNYSASPLLTTYTWPDFKKANAILMKFDLSGIPTGAVVTQATLRLSLVASDTAADPAYVVSVHKVLGRNPVIATATGQTADGVTPWTPNACCFNGVPLAQADISPAYDQRTIDKVMGFKTWTITTMVQEWLADPASNIGLVLNSDASKPRDRYRYFASMEHVDPAGRPYLRVTWVPGDSTPPSVSVTSPSAGATVSGTIAASANASDNVGVAGVQFRLDGANLGAEDNSSPYSISWNTTTATNGPHTLTAVARDAAGNTTTSSGVAVTVNNSGGSAWPNEPAGMTLRTDWGLDQAPPPSGDVSIPGSPGWRVVANASPGSAQGWAARVTDAGAPFSPSNVYDFVYPQGMVEGEAPATVYYDGLAATEVYVGFWWKPSSPFDYGPNGNKIAFIFNGGGDGGGQQFLILMPDGRLHVLPEYPNDFQWRTPNVNATLVTLGAWHRIEWYTNRSNGTMKWWLDGVLQGSYTNVTNSHPFDMFQFSPTWGGNSGATKNETDHYWFDHVHVSTR